MPVSEPPSLEEGCRNASLRVCRKGAGKRALEREAVAHSEHRFPEPSSKLCQNLVTPLKGCLLSPRSCPPTRQRPPKGLGTNKTVEAT